ncbi:FAD-dependent oxidoreductase [Sphingopyxis sp. SE2]|uniref:FAD-dependent oxidoreductase n=1 Tax=Sphingopyxis sp. SE2 TaxID=1586240 RepID=UPI0028C4C320|nr:FAD-dependent oxidoreductase [Sphingopyxis sp. SE2]
MGVAMRVCKDGWSVAIVDEKPFGGTCALRGCDPKKMLVAGAEVIDAERRMRPNGIDGELRIDWPELIAFKRGFTDPIPAKHEQKYAVAGIATFHGTARFTGPNSLTVDGTELRARHILIASGAVPMTLDIPGEEHLIDSEGFMAMESLPRRVVLVGGGYIAAEFSHIAARAGAEVTVLEMADRMLAQFEPELVGWLMESFKAIGVDVQTKTVVKAIEKTDDGFTVHVETGGGADRIDADVVVHTGGRVPALDRLDPAAANIAMDGRRLKLNEYLQSVTIRRSMRPATLPMRARRSRRFRATMPRRSQPT